MAYNFFLSSVWSKCKAQAQAREQERRDKMLQREINELKRRAVDSAEQVPCGQIFTSFGLPTMKRGVQIYTDCPKCGAKMRERKCSVNEVKNLWYCFGCTSGGGAVQAYSLLAGVKWLDAAIILARSVGAISDDNAGMLLDGPADVRNKLLSDNRTYQIVDNAKSYLANLKAPAESTDLVYRHLLSLPEFALTEEAYRHLVNERKLSDAEIREEGFFSYTTPFYMGNLVESIKREKPNFKQEEFNGIPGFYFLYHDKDRGWWQFREPYRSCLGIPLRNADGLITALQMRNLHPTKTGAKYFYVTSSQVKDNRGKCGYGCTPGTPVHVIYPKGEITSPTIYIGEGYFKMREIAKEGRLALSIQGVNSYHYVADEVKALMHGRVTVEKTKNLADKKMRFCICFDMDMYSKIEVLMAACKFIKYLEKNFPDRKVSVLIWDKVLGKGFDDMKFACERAGVSFADRVKSVNGDGFITICRDAISDADREYAGRHTGNFGIEIRKTTEWKELLNKYLYENRLSRLL